MSITAGANLIALNSVIVAILDSATVISVSNAGGEYFRKTVTSIEEVSSTNNIYTFYMNENEANTDITSVSLYGNGATTTFATGTEFITQALVLTKDNTQSLTVDFNLEITTT